MRAWAAAVVLVVAACAPPTLPSAVTLEAAAPTIDVGTAGLHFRERVWRPGAVSLRSNVNVAVRISAPDSVCVGARVEGTCQALTTLSLAAGEWTEIPVWLEVDRLGERTATVAFAAGDAALEVELRGRGEAAEGCLAFNPPSLDFGVLRGGCPVKQRGLRITNNCPTQHLLTAFELGRSSTSFWISSPTPLPRQLTPGSTWTGLVNFASASAGTFAGTLQVQLDGDTTVTVPLTGQRLELEPREWRVQFPSQLLDVLIVLDNSPSFAPLRQSVERWLARDLIDHGWYPDPLRVGVVELGAPATRFDYLHNDELDYPERLTQALSNISTQGSEQERCIETAAQYVNTDFFRTFSRRMAVCVTDAPEQSFGLIDSIDALGDAGVRWEVIGPPVAPPVGCSVEAPDDGKHLATTSALGGSVTPICSNWSLPKVDPVPPPPLVFQLPFPMQLPLFVWVDGLQLPSDDYFFNTATNRLELKRPPVNNLVVRETLACEP